MTKKGTVPEALKEKRLKKDDPRTKAISMQGGLANKKKHEEAKSRKNLNSAISLYFGSEAGKSEEEYLQKIGYPKVEGATKGEYFMMKLIAMGYVDPRLGFSIYDKVSKDQQCSKLHLKILSINVDMEKLINIDYNGDIGTVEKQINDIYDNAIHEVNKALTEEIKCDENDVEKSVDNNFSSINSMTVAEIIKLEAFKNNKIAEWNTQRNERLASFRAQKDALSKHNQVYFDEDGVDKNLSEVDDTEATPSFVQEGFDNNVIKEDDVNLKNDSVFDV
jgi:hypothetical protein